MSLEDRDWFREDHNERAKKYNNDWSLNSKKATQNKVVQFSDYSQKKTNNKMISHIITFVLLFGILEIYGGFFYESSATIGLIIINALVFACIKLKKVGVIELGSSYNLTAKSKQNYRILTSAFTHEDPLHLLFNLSSLYNVGVVIEELLGKNMFIAAYAIIVIVGGAVSCYFHQYKNPNTISIGASGAICGLLGIYIAVAYMIMGLDGLRSVWYTIIILFLMTFSKKIDSIGHFTGLVIGIVMGYFYSKIFLGM